jgi:hypothetical protein
LALELADPGFGLFEGCLWGLWSQLSSPA